MESAVADRGEFGERLRRQIRARYRDVEATFDPERFAIGLTAAGLDVSLPLAPLHNECMRNPEEAAVRIAKWVSSVERQLSVARPADFAPSSLLWCVRSRRYLAGLGRSDELARRPLGRDMMAFVSESLPGSIMRGLPRPEWERHGLNEAEVLALTDNNTAKRFARIGERIACAERIPRDGWQVSGDDLFQGSILTVPGVLRAFVDRAGSEVVFGVPDRSIVFAMPASDAMRRPFARRVNQAYREATMPCSNELLTTDGTTVRSNDVGTRPSRRSAGLMAWLHD